MTVSHGHTSDVHRNHCEIPEIKKKQPEEIILGVLLYVCVYLLIMKN